MRRSARRSTRWLGSGRTWCTARTSRRESSTTACTAFTATPRVPTDPLPTLCVAFGRLNDVEPAARAAGGALERPLPHHRHDDDHHDRRDESEAEDPPAFAGGQVEA